MENKTRLEKYIANKEDIIRKMKRRDELCEIAVSQYGCAYSDIRVQASGENKSMSIVDEIIDLEREIKELQDEVKNVENAVAILPALEMRILRFRYFDNLPFGYIAYKINRSEQRTKDIHTTALGQIML